MIELDECLSYAKQIREKNEQILEMKSRTMSPKNQVFSDMPKGGVVENAMDNYLSRLERLEKSKKKLIEMRETYWTDALNIIEDRGGVSEEILYMLSFRFYNGLSWKRCAAMLTAKYPDSNWNINKCFRSYRYILNKVNNK